MAHAMSAPKQRTNVALCCCLHMCADTEQWEARLRAAFTRKCTHGSKTHDSAYDDLTLVAVERNTNCTVGFYVTVGPFFTDQDEDGHGVYVRAGVWCDSRSRIWDFRGLTTRLRRLRGGASLKDLLATTHKMVLGPDGRKIIKHDKDTAGQRKRAAKRSIENGSGESLPAKKRRESGTQ